MRVDSNFFKISQNLTVAALAKRIGGSLYGGGGDQKITGVAPVSAAGNGDLTFLLSEKNIQPTAQNGAIIITTDKIAAQLGDTVTCLIVDKPRIAFAKALGGIVEQVDWHIDQTNIDETASIHPDAMLAPAVTVGPHSVVDAGAVIGAGVVIGGHCHIASNSVLSHCRLADNVTVGAGTIIGDAGFGFEMTDSGVVKIPHIGIVQIADGCGIGNNCTIDRGSLGNTILGCSVMIDNLCQIAHNVHIGDRTIIAAQCGVSGSVVIGADVQIGGQVGIAQHVTIGDRAVLTARSGVTKDVPPQSQMAGFPAIEAGQFWRERAAIRRLLKTTGRARLQNNDE